MKAPKGFVLTYLEGWYINTRGARATEEQVAVGDLKEDDSKGVFWFDDENPFVPATYVLDGEILNGWNPNGTIKSIKDGWHPPVYMLHSLEEAPNVQD